MIYKLLKTAVRVSLNPRMRQASFHPSLQAQRTTITCLFHFSTSTDSNYIPTTAQPCFLGLQDGLGVQWEHAVTALIPQCQNMFSLIQNISTAFSFMGEPILCRHLLYNHYALPSPKGFSALPKYNAICVEGPAEDENMV